MAKSVEELHEKLMDEYGQVRRKFDQIHTAFDRVITAGPEDDLHDRLLHLEKVVKEVRDGGVVGSGANGHRRALKEYQEAVEAQGAPDKSGPTEG
ncbi:MAG: hypothetical protein JNK12_02645 [Acidimicrobiales bacterium]|nr:hypothetical protein [Acidimicrobiales bacterium]